MYGSPMREDRQALQIIGAATLTLGLVAAWALNRGATSYDFDIYQTLADHYRTTGDLPRPDEAVGRIPGYYADFTPANLRIYEVVTRTKALFVLYEFIVLAGGLALLGFYRQQLGLSARSLGVMCAALVECSVVVLYGYEDKATFFTVVLLAAICVDRGPAVRGATLGLLFGWTGLGLFALPLAVLYGSTRDRVRSAIACVGTAAVLLAVVGGDARTLFANRLDREGLDPFWYSVWHLVGPLYTPTLRTAALCGASAFILWRAWRRRLPSHMAVIALCAINLLASNNTDSIRIVSFIPLGALMFTSEQAQILWSTLAVGYGLLVCADLLDVITVMDDTQPTDPGGLLWVVLVNAPLIAIGVSAAIHKEPHRPVRLDGQTVVAADFRDPRRPTAVGTNVSVVDADEQVTAGCVNAAGPVV
jgi:hypothetical protein